MVEKSPRTKFNKYANLRPVETKDRLCFVVVAVEGKKTEERYFEMLRQHFGDKLRLETITPENGESAPKKLLEKLRRRKSEYLQASDSKKPDSFWMVCDVDSHLNLQSTINDAKKEKLKVAISNPCFEVWLFNHLGKIHIEDSLTKFCDLSDKIVLSVNKGKEVDRKLSQKVAIALDRIYPKKGVSGYKDVYLKKINNAIKESDQNLKEVESKNLLLGPKNIGQTRVGNLIKEIVKNFS